MKKIDLETWSRKEIFGMFSSYECPFYSATIPFDVTAVKAYSKKKNISFYMLMVWVCTKAVNSVDEFNVRIIDGEIYQLDKTEPSYTFMKSGCDCFMYGSTPWQSDPIAFCKSAERTIQNQTSLFGNAENSNNIICFSCTPWFDFTHLSGAYAGDKNDSIPRFVWGKYYPDGDRLMLHMSIGVNHKLIDGYHIGCLKNRIDEIIQSLDCEI